MSRRGPKIHITGELPEGVDPLKAYERQWEHRKKFIALAAPAVDSQLEKVTPVDSKKTLPTQPLVVEQPEFEDIVRSGDQAQAARKDIHRRIQSGDLPLPA